MTLSMVESCKDRLCKLGYHPSQSEKKRKELRLQEKGTVYLLRLQPELNSSVYKIDGDVVKGVEVDRCDYLVLVNEGGVWAETFVELKGSDIAHAIKQIEATITNPLFVATARMLRRARVVMSNRIPANSGNSIVERAKVDLKKKGCDFRVLKSLQPDSLKWENPEFK